MNRLSLTLFVTGDTPRTNKAIDNLHLLQRDYLGLECEITVVDVLEHPDLAEESRIFATPTLIKTYPPPVRRVVGDLSDIEKVAAILRVSAHSSLSTP